MNIKCESEIKIEGLDLEYDSYQQDSQIFSDNESDFIFKAEDIKIEELDENVSTKSELTESEKESVLDEGLVNNNGVIKSENVMMIEEKSCGQHSKSFPQIESMIPLAENIKKELDENSSFIKSEPRESDLEFVFNEEELKNCIIKSKNSPMKKFDLHHVRKFMSVKNVSSLLNKVNENGLKAHFESEEEEYFAQILTSKFPLLLLKKWSYKELKTLMINAAEGEKKLEVKSSSKSKSQKAEVHQQDIKKYHLENLNCRYCNFSFKSKDELKTHLKAHNKRKFKCAHCNYECNFKYRLKNHMLTHSDIKLYKCSHCSYECYQKESLKSHLLTHTNVKLFKCSYCSYGCNQKGNLKSHMLVHANVKLFKCSYCSYGCNRKGSLKAHMLAHANVKLFKCSYCSYESNQKGHLKRHMLTHTNVKLFKCSDCSYECNEKRNLKTHMLTHTNVKLYKCSNCYYECNRKGDLKKHMLTHANVKLFKCSDCSYKCNQKGNLKAHMLTHSNVKLFKCSDCSYECNQKESLKRHMLKH
ncbi:UNVERIFIED_CONTAM: hypothetical protein RMT77_015671 [Armadillidium vulgare]